ncbi:MAG: histidinol-phosphatase [Polyangiaceae bacterium]|nr:histidinol-phosphatase [Polyangiaceae bacterium]
MTPSIDELAQFACCLANASGDAIRPWFRTALNVDNKDHDRDSFDPVTEADKLAELTLRRLIHATYPRHGIVGEEHGQRVGDEPFTWVIDPIDGTRSFICGMLHWGTLIALNDGTRPILGILDQPITRERWIGRPGQATFAAAGAMEQTIRTRACPNLDAAVLTTTHPADHFTKAEADAFQSIAGRVRMTRYGGDCYAYGLLAMGLVDLVVESGLKAWDVQAIIPIVEGAGGLMTSWTGGDAQNGGRVVAAGDPQLHALALEVLCTVK